MKRLNIDRARGLRRVMTDAEQMLWRHLRNRQLSGFKFRRQHEVDHYIVDFSCSEALLVVELDGGQHADQVVYDERRTQQLHAMGYRVLRFWNNDVLLSIESVLTVILDALASPAAHPSPLPRGERGQTRRRVKSDDDNATAADPAVPLRAPQLRRWRGRTGVRV